MRFFSALVVCLLVLSPSISKADFVIAVTAGGSTYVPGSIAAAVAGQTVTMGVWIYDTNGTSRSITSFELGFDVGISPSGSLDGKTALNDFSTIVESVHVDFNSALPYALAASSFTVLSNDALDYDVSVAGAFNAPNLTVAGNTDAKKLFDIKLKTNPLLGPGTYAFSLVPQASIDSLGSPANLNVVNLLVGSAIVGFDPAVPGQPSGFGALGGSFTITAVPEPSSLALVGLMSVGMCLARRRRVSVQSSSIAAVV